MALSTVSFDSVTTVEEVESAMDLLTKNTMTTAGVMVAAGTGVAGAAVLAAALPAQILTAAAVSGGLIYAGDRQSKGLSVNPFAKGADATTVDTTAIES
jgi:tetrahydromethanopterin S-methyltransferase subunit F